MRKFLIFLLVVVALVGTTTSANWVKRFSETEGETFTVLYSKTFTHTGWFGIKSERCVIVASTPSSTNIYHFEVSRGDALPAGKTFTMSFGIVKPIGGAKPTNNE
jgi:hypothetical protein